MRIQRLYIGDFGILRNQTLEQIHPGIVVIGGPNRAGKSTFMQVLRYLGYGFPQGGALPPANSKYEAEADIKLKEGHIYNLRLSGYGQPMLRRISGAGEEITSAEEIYGLDAFTYRQLFTISLDELSKNHNISNHDQQKLQSILLGAGFSDVLLAPQLEEEFYKEADKIGGKRGNPRVKQFKPYSRTIEQGVELKEKGLAQIEEYKSLKQELDEKIRLIEGLQIQIDIQEKELIQLDVIKSNYEIFSEIEELEIELGHAKEFEWQQELSEYELREVEELWKKYYQLDGEYRDSLDDFSIALGIPWEEAASFGENLLKKREKVAKYMSGISGMQERIRQYHFQEQDCQAKEQELLTRIRNTNSSWEDEDLDKILAIPTDHINQNRLAERVEEYKKLELECKDNEKNLDRLKDEGQTLTKRLKKLKGMEPVAGIKKYFYGSLVFTIAGLILSFVSQSLGLLLGVTGIVGTAMILIFRISSSKDIKSARDDLKNSIDDLDSRIQLEQGKLDDLKKQMGVIKDRLDRDIDLLGLAQQVSGQMSYNLLPGYLERLRDIQNRILEIEGLKSQLRSSEAFIDKQFGEYQELISELWKKEIHPKNWDDIIAELDMWNANIDRAQNMKIKEQELKSIRIRLIDLISKYESIIGDIESKDFGEIVDIFLQKGQGAMDYKEKAKSLEEKKQRILYSLRPDRISKAFIGSQSEDDRAEPTLIAAFKEKYYQYISKEDIGQSYKLAARDLDEKNQKLEDLKEDRRKIQQKLDDLSTTDILVRGQRQIDNGRAGLRFLAEEYAVNMMASSLLKEVGYNLLEGMRDTIMSGAGRIFSQLTDGEYEGILPSESLLQSEFQAVLSDNANAQTVEMLSRGTREQLYLSVRLSRIKDIKPSLPIIIDDSFANFDSMHLSKSIKILTQLSKTHQIFVLTCHGKLVEEIAQSGCNAQYWKLDRGRFIPHEWDRLIDYLNQKNLS